MTLTLGDHFGQGSDCARRQPYDRRIKTTNHTHGKGLFPPCCQDRRSRRGAGRAFLPEHGHVEQAPLAPAQPNRCPHGACCSAPGTGAVATATLASAGVSTGPAGVPATRRPCSVSSKAAVDRAAGAAWRPLEVDSAPSACGRSALAERSSSRIFDALVAVSRQTFRAGSRPDRSTSPPPAAPRCLTTWADALAC